MGAFFSKLSRGVKRKVIPQKTMDSRMQKITGNLIRGCVGPRGVMTRAFRKEIRQYSADKNPIGKDEAMNILVNMVKLAVAERSKLEGIIVDQVERGLLYSDYYNDVEKISEMSIKTDACYRETEMIRENYLIEYGFYDRYRMEAHRGGKESPLSEEDLETLRKRIEKLNKYTGFGGEGV